jgi:hypothetical protein
MLLLQRPAMRGNERRGACPAALLTLSRSVTLLLLLL